MQTVTGVEVTIGNCLPDVWEILPDAEYTAKSQQTTNVSNCCLEKSS